MEQLNFTRIVQRQPDKESIIGFLQETCILYNPRICPNGLPMQLKIRSKRDRWRCRSRSCRYEVSLRKDTWLATTKVKLHNVSLSVYKGSQKNTRLKGVKNVLVLNKNTTVRFSKFLPEVVGEELVKIPVQIGGPCLTVEIDESLFSKRKFY